MLADTIPIYWGNPDISREFNSASFINCHDFPTLDDAAAYVQKVDEDDSLWCEIMSRPWKTPEQEARFLEETERETAKLYKIFDQSPEEARRKGDGTWVSYYQRFLKRGHRMQLAWRRLKTACAADRNFRANSTPCRFSSIRLPPLPSTLSPLHEQMLF